MTDTTQRRDEFLMRMYDQMFNDINQHIIVVWKAAGTLVAAFSIFALVEKQIVPLDIAAALVVLIAGWLLCHLEDAAYWYNRNLTIIANIERQFLMKSDLRDVHYYFGRHRETGRMIDHLRIQYVLGVGMGLIVLGFHFSERVWMGLGMPFAAFEPTRALPYVTATIVSGVALWLHRHDERKYREFLKNSPGIVIETEGIEYGEGHPAEPAVVPRSLPAPPVGPDPPRAAGAAGVNSKGA